MNVTARLAVEVGQAPRSTTNSCMSLNAAEFAGSGASSRAAGSRVRGWEGAERRAAAARTRYAPGTRRRRHRARRRRRCSFHSLLSRRVGDWDRTGSQREGERTGGFACWDSSPAAGPTLTTRPSRDANQVGGESRSVSTARASRGASQVRASSSDLCGTERVR
jgi:hypothetical protein